MKDVKVAKGKKRLILATAILLFSVAVVFSISTFFGGAFYDFSRSAVLWVISGIIVAFAMTYGTQEDDAVSTKKDA